MKLLVKEFSKKLDLNREEWDGTKVIQNVPCVYLIDEKGKIQFKYISQYTLDRPNVQYIQKMLEVI